MADIYDHLHKLANMYNDARAQHATMKNTGVHARLVALHKKLTDIILQTIDISHPHTPTVINTAHTNWATRYAALQRI
jgi:proline racemase